VQADGQHESTIIFRSKLRIDPLTVYCLAHKTTDDFIMLTAQFNRCCQMHSVTVISRINTICDHRG